MIYVYVFLSGLAVGATAVFVLLLKKQARLRTEQIECERDKSNAHAQSLKSQQLEKECNERDALLQKQLQEFKSRLISYEDLAKENALLKGDLGTISVTTRKLQLDRQNQADEQARLDARSKELAERWLGDTEQWVAKSINANNYAACKQRLTRAIEWSREIGFDVSAAKEQSLLDKLREDFEMAVRVAVEREEQARIKAQIREEQMREREIERELQTLERERAAIQAALAKALSDAGEAHSAEVDRLKARLAEAEQRRERAISQAQVTKAGYVYVISNIGSFGDNVFKIGMTRRLEPLDRVRELGDASVPFSFDVHMMISCSDAPALEYSLHRKFEKYTVNKVNPRKEFFRVPLDEIHRAVKDLHGDIRFIADAEALEYRQSITMTDEDAETIQSAYQHAESAIGAPESED